MLPERGGAGYFTLLVADRLADLNREFGRAVTLDEVVDGVWNGAGLPWSYVTQTYQQHLCTANANRRGDGITDEGVIPS
ncbi:MAG TPA: hypothetical protein VGH94_13690, partial [Acidimicrobiales bacterium]